MLVTTVKGQRFKVTEEDSFRFIKTAKINQGCFRWILILLVFWPLALLYFFVGDTAYVVEINGENHVVDKFQYERLVDLFDGGV